MVNIVWCVLMVFPVCAAFTLGFVADDSNITFQLVFNIAVIGWFLITAYSGWRFLTGCVNQYRTRHEVDKDKREKFFDILNGANEIQKALKSLEVDTHRHINKLHDTGKEAGFYDRTDKPGTS